MATIVLKSISIVLNVFTNFNPITIGLALLVIGQPAWNRDARDYFG